MKRQRFLKMLMTLASLSFAVSHPAVSDSRIFPPIAPPVYFLPVALHVYSDNQGQLPEFPVNRDYDSQHYRAYVQATPDERYRLRVENNSDQRVGLVIAVDGRNIISGKKSDLDNDERMYVLNPHTSAEYEGWRTGQNQTNRFYFTEANRSYAAAWGDTSAIGVIAMAVYPEKPRPGIYYPMPMEGVPRGAADEAARAAPAPGTGFGEHTYSPSVTVDFEPSSEPMERVFFKYEWRETLCRKGILPDCRYNEEHQHNRFWPDNNGNNDYAPPPPNY